MTKFLLRVEAGLLCPSGFSGGSPFSKRRSIRPLPDLTLLRAIRLLAAPQRLQSVVTTLSSGPLLRRYKITLQTKTNVSVIHLTSWNNLVKPRNVLRVQAARRQHGRGFWGVESGLPHSLRGNCHKAGRRYQGEFSVLEKVIFRFGDPVRPRPDPDRAAGSHPAGCACIRPADWQRALRFPPLPRSRHGAAQGCGCTGGAPRKDHG